MMFCYPRTWQSLFWVQGFYHLEYVRENDAWKISYKNWEERRGLTGTCPPEGLWQVEARYTVEIIRSIIMPSRVIRRDP